MIYDTEDEASYRSFRIVIYLDTARARSRLVFFAVIDEFFDTEVLKEQSYRRIAWHALLNWYCSQNP